MKPQTMDLDFFRQKGKKGGTTTKKKHGVEHYRKNGKKGALKRWSSKKA